MQKGRKLKIGDRSYLKLVTVELWMNSQFQDMPRRFSKMTVDSQSQQPQQGWITCIAYVIVRVTGAT